MNDSSTPNRWKRYDHWDERPLAQDRFAVEDAEHGFCAMGSPWDPVPSLVVEAGRVTMMDGKPAADFDMIDSFIASHHIDPEVAGEAMAIDSTAFARRLVDIAVPRAELVRLATGMTPAKLAEVIGQLSATELTFAQSKLRARLQPGNQAHVTNAKDDPVQMAADAATAALYGFDELETTVRVARNARTCALALTVGAAAVRGGVLVQCSIEEAEELRLGMAGLTSYTETMSVYGTDDVFIDGDDTPWSKAFLTAAYTSRGLKARCTSGAGSEVLMAFHEKKSMLYLEARCLCVQRGMGVQGTQNGGIDGASVAGSVPGGVKEMFAENVMAALLDLECASGNDTRHSHSDMRVAARVLPPLLAGTDLICSGFGSIADYDNSFAISSFNGADLEEYLALQRDYMVDGGLAHVPEDAVMAARAEAIEAIAAVLEELGLATVSCAQKASVLHAHGSRDTATFSLGQVAAINQTMEDKAVTLADVIVALHRRGMPGIAENLLVMARQRVAGDYLQTAAVIRDGKVVSAVNQPNDYCGPGSGYTPDAARREGLARMRTQIGRPDVLAAEGRIGDDERRAFRLSPRGVATRGKDPREVVIAISPGFAAELNKTTGECRHSDVLRMLTQGIAAGGGIARIVRIRHTADTSFMGLTGARLAGSGIAIGIQGKGTTVIHKAGLAPHTNLELFPQAPLIMLEHYRQIGANAAAFALGQSPEPVVIPPHGDALGAKFHVRTALLYHIEAELADPAAEPEDLDLVFLD